MKKSILICFFGMDGSGKSTLSKYLFKGFQERKYNVSYTWWLEGERSFLRISFRKFFPRNSLNSRNKLGNQGIKINKKFSFFFKYFYPRIILIDYLIFGIIKSWIPVHFGDSKILIFDRYFPDTIYALCKEFEYPPKFSILIKLYDIIIPQPDLIFLIKISPELSLRRKKEEIISIENARKIWKDQEIMYSEFLKKFNTSEIVEVDNSNDIDTTKEIIINKTLKYLKKLI